MQVLSASDADADEEGKQGGSGFVSIGTTEPQNKGAKGFVPCIIIERSVPISGGQVTVSIVSRIQPLGHPSTLQFWFCLRVYRKVYR